MLTDFFTFFLILCFIFFLYKTKGECNFANNSLILSSDKAKFSENESSNSSVKYCTKFTKGFENLTFICPKKSANYEGIEIRPNNCFESVRINGIYENLGFLLKGSIFESSETDSTIVRKVFIPPLINEDTFFECTCDNSLTFKENYVGSRGIMRVQLKKSEVFGCDFDHDEKLYKKISYINYYEKSQITSNEIIKCNVRIKDPNVNLVLICPEEYKLFPHNCFENVLNENNIVEKNEFIPNDAKFHIDKNQKIAFASFSLNKKDKTKNFSCQCIKDKNILYANFEYNVNFGSSILHALAVLYIIFIPFLFYLYN